ncbi:hypothetical protein [Chryseobacterium sp. MFBS3-17]|uniref:hypothetical protein n=1 Tax=Chryseobacterium sp. MFBS3-17 TaxID=2886689 RepID=UPI001D0EAEA7|nr:hypothetical protein [Chryseobacterium sp. MFBS3-17]MCC2589550.1 hypothetical protein [Chryseobacterium sp. MFBS3-17]
MKKIFTAIFAIFVMMASAQYDINLSTHKVMEDNWFKSVFQENIADIEGSPYYDSKFNPAKLVGTEEFLPVRYNILHDNLEFIRDEKIMVVPREELYKSFKFSHNGEQIDLINNTYYIKFHEGRNVSGYLKPTVKFQKFQRATSGYQEDKPAKFISTPPDFFVEINGQLTPVPKNQKEFISMFPQRKEQLQKYMKENRIKLNDKNDLNKILRFLNL